MNNAQLAAHVENQRVRRRTISGISQVFPFCYDWIGVRVLIR